MNKKDNVLKQWWFTLITVPAISVFTTVIYWFLDGDQTTSLMMSWLIIFSIGLLIQWIILIRNKVKYRSGHFMFLALVVLASLFVGFFFSVFLTQGDSKWYIYIIVKPLVPLLVLFIIKTIIWKVLHMKTNNRINKEEMLKELEQEVIDLKNDNEYLTHQITSLKEKNIKINIKGQEPSDKTPDSKDVIDKNINE